jgi:hypothetical protein
MNSKSKYISLSIMVVCSLKPGMISLIDDNTLHAIREKHPAHITYRDDEPLKNSGIMTPQKADTTLQTLDNRRAELSSSLRNTVEAGARYTQAYLPLVQNIWEGMRPTYLKLLHERKKLFPQDYTDVSPELTVGTTIKFDYGPYWLYSEQYKDAHNNPQRYQRYMYIDAPHVVKNNKTPFQDLTPDELVHTVAWAGACDILLLDKKRDTANKAYRRVGLLGKLGGGAFMCGGLYHNNAHELFAGGVLACASEIYQRFLINTESQNDIQRCDKLSLDLGGVISAQGLISWEAKNFFDYHIHQIAHRKNTQLFHRLDSIKSLFDAYPSVQRITTSMEYYFKKHREENQNITPEQSRIETLKWALNLVNESFDKVKTLDISVDKLTVQDVRTQIDPIQKQLTAELEKVAARLK